MKLDLEEIRNMVHCIDTLPDIMVPQVGRWCAWPIIKPGLFNTLRDTCIYCDAPINSTPSQTPNLRKSLKLAGMSAVGVWQYLRHGSVQRQPHIAVFCHANNRSEQLCDGRYLNIFLDDILIAGQLLYPVFVVENPVDWGHPRPTVGPCHLFEDPLIFLSGILSRRPVIRQSVKRAATQLVEILKETKLPLAPRAMERLVLHGLSRFDADRKVYGKILRSGCSKGIIVLNAKGVMGKVAAAKERNIPVIEFQHGAFERDPIGYKWEIGLKDCKESMPLPDRLLVFGRAWQKMFVRNGFWTEDEIVPVGSARMERFRNNVSERSKERVNGEIEVLFTTQWTSREFSIPFWHEFLDRLAPESSVRCKLIIKVHPVERESWTQYALLERRFPHSCKVIVGEIDTFSLILQSDIHVSCYSTSLLESLALGIPSISICGAKAAPHGIAGIRSIPKLRDAIVHLYTADDLIRHIKDNMPGSSNMSSWRFRTINLGETLYKKGFVENASNAVNKTLVNW